MTLAEICSAEEFAEMSDEYRSTLEAIVRELNAEIVAELREVSR